MLPTDPHFADWCRQYRRVRCWREGCDELAPLKQDDRSRAVYCAEHLAGLGEDRERATRWLQA